MTAFVLPPPIKEQRSDEREVFALINALRNYVGGSILTMAGTSVLGRAAGTVGAPADITALADGDVLRRAGGTLGFGAIPATSVTGLFYQTIATAGVNLTQRTLWNASTGLTAVDNGGATRTDVTVNLSTGIAGGQSAIGGTAASENLTLSSTTNGTKGQVRLGTGGVDFYDETTGDLRLGAGPWVSGYRVVQLTRNQNQATNFVATNSNAGNLAAAGFTASLENTLTTAPYGAWSVFSSGFGAAFLRNGALLTLANSANGDLWIANQATGTGAIRFGTGAFSERLTILNSGFIGVGNAAPTSKFQIGSDIPGFAQTKTMAVRDPVTTDFANLAQFDSGISSARAGFIVSNSGVFSEWSRNFLQMMVHGNTFPSDIYLSDGTADAGLALLIAQGLDLVKFGVGAYNAIPLTLFTNNVQRLTISSAGTVTISDLAAGGVTYATAGTGLLKIGTSAEVAGAITWPASPRVLVSTGATTAPAGDANILLDTTAHELYITQPGYQSWYNATGANYERVRAFWSANVFNLKSEKGAAGTLRAMAIDADTAAIGVSGDAGFTLTSTSITIQSETGGSGTDLVITGNSSDSDLLSTGWTSVAFTTTTNSNLSLDFTRPGATLQGSPTVASAAAAVADAVYLSTGATVTGTTGITTATGFNGVMIPAFAVAKGDAGAVTIDHAATVYIGGAASGGADVTITNRYALWIDSGNFRYDGAIALGGGAAATLGTIGGSGPGTAAQNKWIKLIVDGTTYYFPLWV